MPLENTNGETKIIKTFRSEVVFLVSLIIFITGILSAYYLLVKQQAVIDTKLDNLTTLIERYIANYDKHLSSNEKDHDLILKISAILKIPE